MTSGDCCVSNGLWVILTRERSFLCSERLTTQLQDVDGGGGLERLRERLRELELSALSLGVATNLKLL